MTQGHEPHPQYQGQSLVDKVAALMRSTAAILEDEHFRQTVANDSLPGLSQTPPQTHESTLSTPAKFKTPAQEQIHSRSPQEARLGNQFGDYARRRLGVQDDAQPSFRVPHSLPLPDATSQSHNRDEGKTRDSQSKKITYRQGILPRIGHALLPDFKTNRKNAFVKSGAYLSLAATIVSWALWNNSGEIPFLAQKPAVAVTEPIKELPQLPEINKNANPEYLFSVDVITGYNNPALPNQKPPATLLINADAAMMPLFQTTVKDLEQDPSGKTVNTVPKNLDGDANGMPLKVSLQQAIEVTFKNAGDEKIAPYTIQKNSADQYTITINRSRFGASVNPLMDNGNINTGIPDKFSPLRLIGTPLTAGLWPDGQTSVSQAEADRVNKALTSEGGDNTVINDAAFLQMQLLVLKAFEMGNSTTATGELSKILDESMIMNIKAVAKRHNLNFSIVFDDKSAYDMDFVKDLYQKDAKLYETTKPVSELYPVNIIGVPKVIVSQTYVT